MEFVVAVLRGWRSGQAVCPVENAGETKVLDGLPDSWVHLKTTSASTGAARWVGFTAEQLMADAAHIVATMGLRPSWPNLAAISLAHSYGFSNLILPLLLHGIPLILAGSNLPEGVRRAARIAPFVTLPGVPALWRAWLDANAIPSNIRLAISAGAALPLSLERNVFESRGLKIHNFYGSTECGGIAYDRSGTPRRVAEEAGSPLDNVDVSVQEDGCLTVQSAAVGAGYWPEPSSDLTEGRFVSNDLAEIRDGTVLLRGRRSDLINIAGRKVSPDAIEQALGSHPAVAECVVFGVPVPTAERGEVIVAGIRVRAGIQASVLRTFLLDRLPDWQVPREFWIVDEPLANPRGKISRSHWRAKFMTPRPSRREIGS